MSFDSSFDDRPWLSPVADPNAWLFNCYVIGLKRRNPWFLVATSYLATVSDRSPCRGLRDFEYDRHWLEIEAVFRFRRRIAHDDDFTFDQTFPFRRLLEEATAFVILTDDELKAVLAGKSRDSLELRFEHFSELLNTYPRATFEDLMRAMWHHWIKTNKCTIPEE